ncbi:hypothetical protein ASF03_21220 [Rhizobium sp. Leaf68]|nr:hypothetical protein ASE62_20675 [Rhizobium sp. Leaf202]KQN80445.1 hypothetical protein ASF03_21220 [Rhizobium sp. Leaf68]
MRVTQNPSVRSLAVLRIRRAEVEARIEELIALLDLLDGDENLEPYLAGTYPEDEDREYEQEREPEDNEANGDELDGSRAEDEWRPVRQRRRRRA